MKTSVCTMLALAVMPPAVLANAPFEISPLGTVSGADDTIPVLINNSQIIVGCADVPMPSGQAPFFLSTSDPLAFAASPGNTIFTPQAINNSSAIAGFLMPDLANPLPAIYSAALYQNGQFTLLAPPQLPPGFVTDNFRASGINNLGGVVGWVAEVGDNNGYQRAVLWTNGQPSWIDSDASERSAAMAINDNGWIAGITGPASNAYGRPVVWHDGTATYLPLPPDATSGAAIAINNAGQVLVTYLEVGFGNKYLLWDDGAETLLPSSPDDEFTSTFADSMNAAGIVVGTTGGRAVLWQDGQIYNLSDLIPPDSGWILGDATSINDAGDIVGGGTYDGVDMPFLLTPTGDGSYGSSSLPEPASLSLLAFGSVALLRRRRRN